jgi:hypothetical protein
MSAANITMIGGASPILKAPAPSPKDFATAQAKFAIAGHQLIHGRDPLTGQDDYVVNRWGWVRHFKTWAEVLAFLDTIGGRA